MQLPRLPCPRTSTVVSARALYCGIMSTALLSKDNTGPFAHKENGILSSPVKAKDQTTATKRARSEDQSRFRVKKLTENATLPVRGSAGAAGYDLARSTCQLCFHFAPLCRARCEASTKSLNGKGFALAFMLL